MLIQHNAMYLFVLDDWWKFCISKCWLRAGGTEGAKWTPQLFAQIEAKLSFLKYPLFDTGPSHFLTFRRAWGAAATLQK